MGTEEDILIGLDEGRDLLDRDTIPNRNQSLTCFACDARMVGLYCHECGNKNDDYRRSIFSLLVELFQNLTAIDSRMWRSLRALLFQPGRMAREFADGARSRWTSPVRFYIAASILLFGYITLSQTQIIAVGSVQDQQGIAIAEVTVGEDTVAPRLHFFVRKSRLSVPDDDRFGIDGDALISGLQGRETTDPETLQEAIAELDADIEAAQTNIERNTLIAIRDNLRNSAETDLANGDEGAAPPAAPGPSITPGEGRTLNFTGLDGRRVTLDREGVDALLDLMLRRPELFNEQVNDHLKLALFFMMPLAMLMGALFIRGRRNAMLYDHLVHAAYIHAFSFILLLVFILLHQYTEATFLILPYTLILLFYLPLSARRMFARGRFKSIFTAFGVGSVYTLVMFVTFSGIVVLAVNNVAADLSDQRARMQAIADRAATGSPSEPTTVNEPAPTEGG